MKVIEQMAQSHQGQMKSEIVDLIITIFHTTCICGHGMLRLGDSDWNELISFTGFRIHFKAAVNKIIEKNKREAISELQREGLAKVHSVDSDSFFKPATKDERRL